MCNDVCYHERESRCDIFFFFSFFFQRCYRSLVHLSRSHPTCNSSKNLVATAPNRLSNTVIIVSREFYYAERVRRNLFTTIVSYEMCIFSPKVLTSTDILFRVFVAISYQNYCVYTAGFFFCHYVITAAAEESPRNTRSRRLFFDSVE